jgi:uncharacterized repeat protein (TIGR01451 family)
VGIAIDSDSGYLFITYETSESVYVLDARTMTEVESLVAPGATDLAGIVYDHDKKLVYCVDRGEDQLYIYGWDAETTTLTHMPNSPVSLWPATAYGIALDEIDDLLYVANGTKKIHVYETSIWRKVDRVSLNRTAISVAVDSQRGLVYAGAGYADDMYLSQYHLETGTIEEVQVELDAGVMGIGVDMDTGYVYLSTGVNNAPGGDNLQTYDTELNLIDEIPIAGDPVGLVVPIKDISFNPLDLQKTVIRGASHSGASGDRPTVDIGDVITYGIHFNNFTGATVTDISIVDMLPSELIFVSADDEGLSGSYDPKTHSFTWNYSSWPPEVPTTLELAAQVKKDVEVGQIISNSVTINSKQTPPTTKHLEVVTGHNPLNLTKVILGGIRGQVTSVKTDSSVTYVIEFDNANEFPVTNVTVLDVLPKEVTFVSADKGTVLGKYDPDSHMCLWSLASLKTGEAVHLELEVHVKPGLAKGTIFANTVTLENKETPTATAIAEAIVGETPSTGPELTILPEVIRRGTPTYDIQASIIFQEGIGRDDIADVLPTLYPGEVTAKELFIYGSSNRSKVIALFDKNELLDAVKGTGEMTFQMVGMLTSGRSYSAQGTVLITKYSGS